MGNKLKLNIETMKNKNLKTKLQLTKNVIAKLNNFELNGIKGAAPVGTGERSEITSVLTTIIITDASIESVDFCISIDRCFDTQAEAATCLIC